MTAGNPFVGRSQKRFRLSALLPASKRLSNCTERRMPAIQSTTCVAVRRSGADGATERRGARRTGTNLVFWCICAFAAGLYGLSAQDELPRRESRFTLARIYYDVPAFRWWGPIGASNGPPWSHDWPTAEENFMKIMAEVTKLDVNPGGHIISFENEEVFKYPIAYLCEVGYINLSEKEAHNMGEYLLRGGFLIVDDFRGERELANFERQMKLVFPDRSLEELPRTHPIWTCFYDIRHVFPEPFYSQGFIPKYLGMTDDEGRLMMVVDYNNDISEYWEWSSDPFRPIEQTNEAYKYGVNYVMYALTH